MPSSLDHTFYSFLARWRSAGVVIKGNPDKLWILGGIGSDGSSEYIYLDGTVEDGPTIEDHSSINHCLVQSNRLEDISSPDVSTPSFNSGPFNSRRFNHELFNLRLFNYEFLNHGVEMSGVEMSTL